MLDHESNAKKNPKCVTQVWVFSYSRGQRKLFCLVAGRVWAWSYQLPVSWNYEQQQQIFSIPWSWLWYVDIHMQGAAEQRGMRGLMITSLVLLCSHHCEPNIPDIPQLSEEFVWEMFYFDEVKAFRCNFIFIILLKYFSKVEILLKNVILRKITC